MASRYSTRPAGRGVAAARQRREDDEKLAASQAAKASVAHLPDEPIVPRETTAPQTAIVSRETVEPPSDFDIAWHEANEDRRPNKALARYWFTKGRARGYAAEADKSRPEAKALRARIAELEAINGRLAADVAMLGGNPIEAATRVVIGPEVEHITIGTTGYPIALVRQSLLDGQRMVARTRDLVLTMRELVIAARKLRHSAECKTERAKDLTFIARILLKAEKISREDV